MSTIAAQNASAPARIQEALDEERRHAAEDRQRLTALMAAQAESQEARMADMALLVQKTLAETGVSLDAAATQYSHGMDSWDVKEGALLDEIKKTRDQLKTRLKDDWTATSERSMAMQNSVRSVHAETVRVVDEQIEHLDTQMEALDDFVARARAENASHHDGHAQSMQALSKTVEHSFGNISAHFKTTFDRVKNLGEEMELDTGDLRDGLQPLGSQLCQPLANLRDGIASTSLHEYQPTGDTPQKVLYTYPKTLPRTEPHEDILAKAGESPCRAAGEHGAETDDSVAFSEADPGRRLSSPLSQRRPSNASSLDKNPLSMSLRDPNVDASSMRGSVAGRKRPSAVADGRENLPPAAEVFSQGASRRKSPRLH